MVLYWLSVNGTEGVLTNGEAEGEVEGCEELRGSAEVVQFSALAAELAGRLELAIAACPDLGLAAEEFVARANVADRAVKPVVVVVVDARGDGGVGAVGCDGVDGVLVEGSVVALDLAVAWG
ncbi:hypothetical protein OV090_21225 [Nannocystis sp. RBIL2]|uniref:hypothetical protein n=1 Tax=Nannocystis sp. RBIL2 TaxID=2996788 RepID=UPI0022721CD9|nr:hypothetical protein [Nannocystis sp. RBIL2]MCY1067286.1 hypothetical protein [Nannocystis sp. RBIL2]